MPCDKIQLVLNPCADISRDDFAAALASATNASRDALAPGLSVQAGVKLASDPIAGMAHDDGHGAVTDNSGLGLVALWSDGSATTRAAPSVDSNDEASPIRAALTAAARDLVAQLSRVIDTPTCVVLAGQEHAILPGSGALQLVFLLRRRDHLDRPAFQHYWLHHHADFAVRQNDERIRYRQLHNDSAWGDQLAATLGGMDSSFDGSAQGFYLSEAEIRAVFANPAVASDAYEDEKTFIDHSRSCLRFYQLLGQA